MNYCIYLRKSRADAEAEERGEGETLARHEKALLDLAKRQHLNISKIYKEVVSGDTIAARPIMQQLLSDIEGGLWDGVLVMEVERLARGDTIDQGIVAQTFKFSGTKIITPIKTYDPNNEYDEEYFEFGLFMSRREYKTINRRLQRGREASVKEGKYVASMAPYGYERVKIKNDKGYTLAVVPDHAEIVKMIFDWYVNGVKDKNGECRRLGIQQIARKLNELHVPPIRHDYWQKETIRDMIINPAYIGKVRWRWRPYKKKMVKGKTAIERPRNYDEDCIISDGLHPAIVDKDVFERAQALISDVPTPPVGYKKELKNPLAGIIICGECGRKMVFRSGESIGKKDYIICHARGCKNIGAPFELIEKRVLETLQQWLLDYKLECDNRPIQNKHDEILQKSIKRIEGDISTLEKQLSSTYDLLERGIYSTDEFLNRSRSISDRIQSAKENYKSVESELGLSHVQEDNRKNIVPKIEHLLDIYDHLSSASAKNELLKEILEKAVYVKTASGSLRGNSADDFMLDLYPKLPQKRD